jgi:hypothetical protein
MDAGLRDRLEPEPSSTGATFSISHLLPCNLKLRSFRGDGPHFDGLTVAETGTVFSYLHRSVFRPVDAALQFVPAKTD